MSCSKKLKGNALLELIAWGRAELLRVGIEEAREECERILMKLFGCSRSGIYLEEHELAISGVREQFLALLEKRLRRIPLAYLLNETDFWQETLYVDERCLIPRPETEILVETVIKAVEGSGCAESLRPRVPPTAGQEQREAIPFFKTDRHAPLGLAMTNWKQTFSFLDIGTGSGAIAIAILRAFKNARGTLLDISGEALEVARMNTEKYGLNPSVIAGDHANGGATRQSVFKSEIASPLARNDNKCRARLVCGDLFEPFSGDEKWDLIVSNPPYLSEEDWNRVQEELEFEPRMALDGGKDGLDFYRKIIVGAKNHLVSGGLLVLEAGQGQAPTVSKWLQTAGYDNIHRFKDLSGIERVVIARNKRMADGG